MKSRLRCNVTSGGGKGRGAGYRAVDNAQNDDKAKKDEIIT